LAFKNKALSNKASPKDNKESSKEKQKIK
jgi:hypothetical protein